MTPTQLPTAAQIGAYLTAHGWRFDRSTDIIPDGTSSHGSFGSEASQ